jgi:hypothetical protein
MNHVFMDFENVHKVDFTLIGAKSVSFTLMVGEKQTKLDTGLVEKLMEHSSSVRLVKLKSSAKNSLDFALAYYLGRAVLADPTAYFHVIAKDTGYDPLIEHLCERHFNVRRHVSCAELTFSWPGKALSVSAAPATKAVAKKAAKKAVAKKVVAKKTAKKAPSTKTTAKKVTTAATPLETWLERVEANLRKYPKDRPGRKKTLLSKVGQLIGKKADDPHVQSVIDGLQNAGHLSFGINDVPSYHL